MSKIYEALLRAEQERIEEKQAGDHKSLLGIAPADKIPAPLPQTPAISLVVRESDSGFTTDLSPASEAPTTTAASSTPGSELSPQRAAVSFQEIIPATTELWHPDIRKLPALRPHGRQVEQFRGLRSKLFEFRSLTKLKSVLVSSAMPSDGKSFVSINLAIMFARHKSARVLLIDGDLRRSSQHKMLGSSDKPGLAEYLAGKVSLDQAMHRGTAGEGSDLPAGLSSLTFIPSGKAGDSAADLSGSPRFSNLIQTLGPQFDWIVVDSSPVNVVADGANMARACDGVLFVARGGVTRLEAAQRALSELQASNILGVVLNAAQGKDAGKGYYGYDSYESTND